MPVTASGQPDGIRDNLAAILAGAEKIAAGELSREASEALADHGAAG